MTAALVLFFCVAVPFAITLGIGLAVVVCEWAYRKLRLNR